MRTFLPFSDFRKCAECFTMKRLTKQRHDVMQILYMLSGRTHPSINDRFMYNSPPKKVWCQIPYYLLDYGYALCSEYARRTGKPDPLVERLDNRKEYFNSTGMDRERPFPNFLSSEAMQKSHRAILAREDETHYAKFGFLRCPDDEKVFYWPVEEAQAQYDPRAVDEERRRERDRRRRDEDRDREDRRERGEDVEDDDSWLDDQSGADPQPVYNGDECDCEACRRERELSDALHSNRSYPVDQSAYAAITRPWLTPPSEPVAVEPEPPLAPTDIRTWQQAINNNDYRSFEQLIDAAAPESLAPAAQALAVELERRTNRDLYDRYLQNSWGTWGAGGGGGSVSGNGGR